MPIVGVTGDPQANGWVKDISRPEANITGFSVSPGADWVGKYVQYARELMPDAKRLGLINSRTLMEPPNPSTKERRLAAAQLGFELIEEPIDSPINEAEFQRAFATLIREQVELTIIGGGADIRAIAPTVAKIAFDMRMPAIGQMSEFSRGGGLMSFSTERDDLYAPAAGYIARVLRGTPISELPYQQPTKFDFIINLKTARALGIEFPLKILLGATEVID